MIKDDETLSNNSISIGDNRWSFPADYVTFLVHKTNLVTSDVASTLASRLK